MTLHKHTLTSSIQTRILEEHILRHGNGQRIPTEKELAAAYNVSITTIRRAVSLLVSMGKLEKRHGSGTFIKDGNVECSVAVLVPERAYGDFYQLMALSLEPKLRAYGIDSRIYVSDTPKINLNSMRNALSSHDAIILCGYGATPEELASFEKPFLVVGSEVSCECPYIGLDMLSAYRQVISHLCDTGCSRIRLLMHWPHAPAPVGHDPETDMRVYCFRTVLREKGMDFSSDMILRAGISVPEFRKCLGDMLESDNADALICSNDVIALEACRFLTEQGVKIPDEISVIAGNNTLLESQHLIPMSAIDFRFDSLAISTSRLLDSLMMQCGDLESASCFVRPQLILRQTTRPLKK